MLGNISFTSVCLFLQVNRCKLVDGNVDFDLLRCNSLNFSLPLIFWVVWSLRVSVRFFTTLREVVGKKEEMLQFPKGEKVAVNDVLDRLSKENGKAFKEYVYDRKTGEVRGFLQFLVNGRSVSSSGGLASELSDGDVLVILPPVGGG